MRVGQKNVYTVVFLLIANNSIASSSDGGSSEPFGMGDAIAGLIGMLFIMFVVPVVLKVVWEGISTLTKKIISKIPSKVKIALTVTCFVSLAGFGLWTLFPEKADGRFFESVKKGDIQEVRQDIAEDSDLVNEIYKDLGTPCHIAAKRNDVEMLKTLVENGADVNHFANLGDEIEVTPLLSISGTDNVDAARFLIEAGADVNLIGQGAPGGRMTALHGAATSGNLEMVKLLVEAGADINKRGVNDFTPLHFALANVDQINKVPVVAYLLDNGADINAEAIAGMTPLHLVSIRGTPEIVRLLVSRGANVNAKGQNGSTPLDIARKKEKHELVRIMENH